MRRLLMLLPLLILLLGGCALFTGPEPTPTPVVETPEPTPPPTPTPKSPEQLAREARLEEAQDGFVWEKGFLYAIDSEGDYRKDCYIGVLHFGDDGRYTSGLQELDQLVATVLNKIATKDMTRFEKLHAAYDYTRDNIKYVGFGNHDLSYKAAHGEDGWMPEQAAFALANQKGNCYHFAAVFSALARGLGYQAYATSGVVGALDQGHGWVEIVDDDGTIYYCDPETEYARFYWQQEKVDLFWKTKDLIGYETGLGYSWYVDPFEAEKDLGKEEDQPEEELEEKTEDPETDPEEKTESEIPETSPEEEAETDSEAPEPEQPEETEPLETASEDDSVLVEKVA